MINYHGSVTTSIFWPAVKASASGTTRVQAGGDITLSADTTTNSTRLKASSTTTSVKNSREEERLLLSTVGGDQGVTLLAGHSLLAEGAQVNSDSGSVAVSAQNVTVSAGNDLIVSGSAVAAEHDVSLRAGNNVDISAAVESESHFLLEEKKKSGLLSSGGIGFTIGSQSTRHEIDEKGTTQSQSVSTVGSSQGSVSIAAGSQLHVGGADLVAGRDLTLSGDSVSVDPGYDRLTRSETWQTKQSGLSIALSGTAGSLLNNAVSSAQQAGKESDSRLSALQGTKALLSGVQAAQAVALNNATAGNNEAAGTGGNEAPSSVGISASWSSQTSETRTQSQSVQSQGSTLSAGGNLSVTATGGDIAVTGSQLKAGGDLTLDAARDISLLSAQNSSVTATTSHSSGYSAGIGIGVGSGGAGITISASANASKGHENGNALTHAVTTLDAGSTLTLNSGRDTTLKGAQAGGETVIASVGRDLTLQSERDSNYYDARQQSISGGGSFTFGAGAPSGSLSFSRDKINSNYDSVQEQTGLFAGAGGFDVTASNHTQLDGAVIASTAEAGKNSLDTGTLGWSNIDNRAEYKTEHVAAGFSSSMLSGSGSPLAGIGVNLASSLLAGMNGSGSASSVTQAAVSEGSLVVRDAAAQQQDVTGLSRDAEHAHQALSPIFDKEKEQNRLKQSQLIAEIGTQVLDIARTQGEISGLNKAREAHPGLSASDLKKTDTYQAEMKKYGTGSALQQGIQAATAAVQGLAGGNLAQAITGAAAPYLAEQIHRLAPDEASRAMAHAVVGAVTSYASGNSALAGATGAVMGELVAQQLYPGVKPEDLTEEQKQIVSALGTLAAGLAGGIAGGSTADAIAGAQAGKNAVENNFLSTTSSDKLDKVIEKIRNGDKSLAAANELLTLENADKRSDTLVVKFTKDPAQMNSTERAELAGYLRVYAAEMEKEYGTAVSQELVKGLLSGQDYIKRNPDSEAMEKAQTIMNTWGYHKSNASIGDVPLIFGSSVLGLTVKGMAANAAIGVGVNTGVQLAGKDPFSYVDVIMAGVTAAATTGKGILASAPVNMGGAAIGSGIKGEDPTNSSIAAGVGSIFGGGIGKVASEQLKPVIKEGSAEIIGAVTGSAVGEITGNKVKDNLDKAGEKNGKN